MGAAAYTGPVRAAFHGQWMVPGALGGVPAWLIVENYQLALLAPGASASGFVDVFRVPVQQAKVSSAAQRITVQVAGTKYVVMARPLGPIVGAGMGAVGSLGGLAGSPAINVAGTAAQAGSLAADAAAFARQGGHDFLNALRQVGVPVRRVGYGPLLAIGLLVGLCLVVVVTIVTVAALA